MDNKIKAIICMLISSLSFAFMNVFIKISHTIPMFERIFFINVMTLIFTYIIQKKDKKRLLGKKESRKYLFIRALLGYLALITNFHCVSKLLLADSAILNKLSPFFVMIFAFIFLKERITKTQRIVLLVVFLGAILVIKPKFTVEVLPAFIGVLSAIFSGGAYTLLRFLGDKEDFLTILFYFSIVSIVGTLPIMMTNFEILNLSQIIALLIMGIFWIGGQSYMTFAYKYAKAGEVSIYSYSNIVFAAILGFIIFKEYPDALSCIGGLLIIFAGTINIYLHK